MKFYIVDAFTETLFGGNPAGIVILDEGADFPSNETMRKTAAELRYSETAFIKPLERDQFQIRYFTSAAEVDLCGHATIGAFAALQDADLVSDGHDYINHTIAGQLTIKLQQGFIMMEMGKPEFIAKMQDQEELERLYTIMGLPYEPVIVQQSCSQYLTLAPMIISTGLPDIIMPIKSRKSLAAMKPNFEALSELSKKYHVTGIHAFTVDRESYDVTAHCRNFAPLYGINEEAATGTASGALTYYLHQYKLIPDEKQCMFIQGEAMERPSKILTHIRDQAPAPLIQVGGNAAILAKGEIELI